MAIWGKAIVLERKDYLLHLLLDNFEYLLFL